MYVYCRPRTREERLKLGKKKYRVQPAYPISKRQQLNRVLAMIPSCYRSRPNGIY